MFRRVFIGVVFCALSGLSPEAQEQARGSGLDGDYAVPAALAANAIGRPVKMIRTRADDMRCDGPRPASRQVLRLAWGEGNRIAAMDHHAAAGWPTAHIAPDFMPKDARGNPYDLFAISGADHWYTVGAHRVRALRHDLADRTFRPGYLRSVGAGWTSWAVESFIDEAAHAAGVDWRCAPPGGGAGPGCTEGRVGPAGTEGCRHRPCLHFWTGAHHADVGRLCGSRARQPDEWPRDGGKAEPRDRYGDRYSSG